MCDNNTTKHGLISGHSDSKLIPSLVDEVRRDSRKPLKDKVSNLAIHNCDNIPEPTNRFNTPKNRSKDDTRLIFSQGADILPLGILGKIFHLFNGSGVVVFPPIKSTNFSLWRLCHVCGRWRLVFWDSSKIWGQLTVELSGASPETRHVADDMFGYNPAATNDVFVYVLSKTKTNISLTAGSSECESIFQTIIAHSKRFRKLHLNGLQANMFLSMLKQPPGAWENLEALDISWQENINVINDNTTSSLQSATNLRTVSFSYSPPTYNPQLLFLPWAQLVELHIANMKLPVPFIYATLERCPGLVSALLSIQYDPMIPAQEKITLPNLLKLDLTTATQHPIFDRDNFLQPLLTPALTCLSFRSRKIAVDTTKAFIINSGSSLQEFTLTTGNRYEDGENIESLFSLLSGVKRLNVHWFIPTPVVRRIITGKDGLLPCLTWGHWRVDPSGLAGAFEMVDSYVSNSVGREPLSLTIGCYEGPGFSNVVEAYLESYGKYQNHDAFKICVYNADTHVSINP